MKLCVGILLLATLTGCSLRLISQEDYEMDLYYSRMLGHMEGELKMDYPAPPWEKE